MLQPIRIETRRRREGSTVEWLACRATKGKNGLSPNPGGQDWMYFADQSQADKVLFEFGFCVSGGVLDFRSQKCA